MNTFSVRAHHIHLLLLIGFLGVSVCTLCNNGLFFPSWPQDACLVGAGMIGRAIGPVAGAFARVTPTGCNSTNSFSFACTFPGTGRNRVTGLRTEIGGLTSCCVIYSHASRNSHA